jgi:4-amino-4-deoxychorismate lyase
MYPLFESIKLLDGQFSRLNLHQDRIDTSCKSLFKIFPAWRLETHLSSCDIPAKGLYKCRVSYSSDLVKAEFIPYERKPVRTLKLIFDNEISYEHKLEDRAGLANAFAKRGSCNDILIVKNGMITDTSYSNIVFGKDGKWFTPSSYLLPGTMRKYLLNSEKIEAVEITETNFRRYECFKLINALLEWDSPELEVSNIC